MMLELTRLSRLARFKSLKSLKSLNVLMTPAFLGLCLSLMSLGNASARVVDKVVFYPDERPFGHCEAGLNLGVVAKVIGGEEGIDSPVLDGSAAPAPTSPDRTHPGGNQPSNDPFPHPGTSPGATSPANPGPTPNPNAGGLGGMGPLVNLNALALANERWERRRDRDRNRDRDDSVADDSLTTDPANPMDPANTPDSDAPNPDATDDSSKEDPLRFHIKLTPSPKAWFVYFSGNAGNACDRMFLIKRLEGLDVNIVLVEYPGYAGDPSDPTEQRLLENALKVYDYLHKEMPALPFFVGGESLGTAVATYVAKEREVNGLVLYAAFPDAMKMARHLMRGNTMPMRFMIKSRFEADKWAKDVKAPALFLHGVADKTIPVELGEKQAKNFKSEVKFVTIERAGHYEAFKSKRLWDEFHKFIKSHF